MATKKLTVISSIILVLAGCANLRQAPSAKIETMVRVKQVDRQSKRWSAPELEVRHFRTQFYGYDTVYYRLSATKPDLQSGVISYRLEIDANYGSTLPRHYETAKMPNLVAYPLKNSRHEATRCQMFGTMTNACLYRDQADLDLSALELEAGRQSGLTLTLGSSDKAYESIDLPAQYIDGFLQAVNHSTITPG